MKSINMGEKIIKIKNMKKEEIINQELEKIIYTQGFNNYQFIDNYESLLELVKKNNKTIDYYEYISSNKPLTLYFDVDGKDITRERGKELYDKLVDKVRNYFKNYSIKILTMSSHRNNLYSLHIIVRLFQENIPIMFKNIEDIISIISQLELEDIIDMKVYRKNGGLFRIIYSDKKQEKRLLMPDYELSTDNFTDIETFIHYIPNNTYNIYELKIELKNKKRKLKDIIKNIEITRVSEEITSILKNILVKLLPISTDIKYYTISIYKKEPTIYSIIFKSICIFKKIMHKSNNNYFSISQKTIRLGCYGCDRYVDKDTNLIVSEEETSILFEKDSSFNNNNIEVKDQIIEFINKTTDKGVKLEDILYDNGQYIADTTPLLQDKYKNLVSTISKHIISKLDYKITGNEDITINSFRGSNIQNNIINYTININLNSKTEKEEEDFYFLNKLIPDNVITAVKDVYLHKSHYCMMKLYTSLHRNCIFCEGNYYLYKKIWIKDVDNIEIMSDIATSLTKLLYDITAYCNMYGKKTISKNLLKLVDNIQNYNNLSSISKLLKIQVLDCFFTNKLDNNWNIIPFINGIYDIETASFRDHYRVDYVSQTVGYDYNPGIYNEDLLKFLNDILPVKEERDYLISICSSFLNGKITNDFLLFIIGTGSNGKSLFMNLLNITLGELCSTVPSTLFSRSDTDSNTPRPDLLALKQKRFAYITEPDSRLNAAIVKKLCGSDWISCRNLYKSQVNFQFKTKFAIACNDIPEFSNNDDAIWRRIRIIKFNTKFVTNPNNINEKLLNPDLLNIINTNLEWRQSFMNILLDNLTVTPVIPTNIKLLTSQYLDISRNFSSYLKDNLIYCESSTLKFADLLAAYYSGDGDAIPNCRSIEYKKLFSEANKYIDDNLRICFPTISYGSSNGVRGWKKLKLNK